MNDFKPTILYVEDDEGIREQLINFLKYFSSELYTAMNGQDGLELYHKHKPDIVVSDIQMPIMDGIEMLSSIKKVNERQYAIFTTAFNDSDYLMEAIELQVDGYILKPIDLGKLEAKIEAIIEHIYLKKELKKKIYSDYLTELSSRYAFFEDIHTQEVPVVFLVDIDKFKVINEVYGSDIGSKVLVAFAKELEKIVAGESYKLYRISADEFAIVDKVEHVDTQKYEIFIEKLLSNLDNLQLDIDDNIVTVDITLGISTTEHNGYESAKTALDYAKAHKKPFMMFTSAIDHKAESLKILKIKNEISLAIDEQRVKAVYQPIVNQEGKILKYETLMRLQKKESDALIAPLYFLDVAIKTRLYENLSSTIIFRALQHLAQSEDTLSINFTYSDIANKAFVHKIEAFLLEHKNVGRRAVFEITESESIENYDEVKSFIKRFRKHGVKIAIDDFGSGFSNFEYILEIEPDYLKIDGSLVKDIDTDKKSYTLVEAIVGFSHKLAIRVIAEYVHCEAIFEMLKELEVDEYQGFYFAQPLREI
ncbi:MAG: EAL domain-containing protein [Campylobacterota bacterium]|nr:EAL domain-containing protein [Campylobacterota bacterium]